MTRLRSCCCWKKRSTGGGSCDRWFYIVLVLLVLSHLKAILVDLNHQVLKSPVWFTYTDLKSVCLYSQKQFWLCTQLEGRQADLKGVESVFVYVVESDLDYVNRYGTGALQVCLAPFQLRT